MSRRDPGHPRHARLRAFVCDALGKDAALLDVSRDVGRQSLVWRVTSRGGGVHYMKQPESEKLYERERNAYLRWTPRLAGVPGTHVPELLSHDDDLRAIVVTSLPGAVRVHDLPEEDPRRPAAFERAGALLRALHGLEMEEPLPDPVALVRGQMELYLPRFRTYFDDETFAWAVRLLDDAHPFVGAPVGAAHRDWSPRNWVVAGEAPDVTVSVFDWERAAIDVQWQDMQRMEHDDWFLEPRLKGAFFRGYGRTLSAREAHQLDLVVLLNCLGAIPWAHDRGDTPFETLVRATLARLRERL